MEELKECIACLFTDSQETLVDTPDGWIHQECLDDQQAELKAEYSAISELNNEKLSL